MARIQFKAQCHALVSIQSLIRGWLIKKKYNRRRLELRWQAASTIQKKFQKFKQARNFRNVRALVMKL